MAPLCAVFRRFLKSRNLKYTPERADILDAIIERDGVFEVEELMQKMRADGQRVSKATAYRTIKLLQDAGIITQALFDSKQAHYQLIYGKDPQDSMVCMRTGRVINFRNEELVALRDRICREHGWDPMGHRFQIYGISPEGRVAPVTREPAELTSPAEVVVDLEGPTHPVGFAEPRPEVHQPAALRAERERPGRVGDRSAARRAGPRPGVFAFRQSAAVADLRRPVDANDPGGRAGMLQLDPKGAGRDRVTKALSPFDHDHQIVVIQHLVEADRRELLASAEPVGVNVDERHRHPRAAYSCAMTNVGLDTASGGRPSPSASPRVKVVLPAPSGPSRVTTSPPRSPRPMAPARRWVADSSSLCHSIAVMRDAPSRAGRSAVRPSNR